MLESRRHRNARSYSHKSGSKGVGYPNGTDKDREEAAMPTYVYDHIHLRTRDPKGMAEYFHRIFDAKVIESVQSDGQPRVDLDINGLIVFIAPVAADAELEARPDEH